MGRKTLAVVQWEALRLWQRLSWPIWAAFVIALGACWFGYRTWRLNSELLHLSIPQAEIPRRAVARITESDSESALQEYYRSLPSEDERFMLVRRLLLLAERQGVMLQQVDYKLEPEKLSHVSRYQLTLPLRGEYARIQSFLIDALNENRSVVIDSLSIKRESSERGDVDARIQLSIMMVRS